MIAAHPLIFVRALVKGLVIETIGIGSKGIDSVRPAHPPADGRAGESGSTWPALALKAAAASHLAAGYLFCVIALIVCPRSTRSRHHLLLALVIPATLMAVVAGPAAYSRYRVPVMPFFCWVAAHGIAEASRRWGLVRNMVSRFRAKPAA